MNKPENEKVIHIALDDFIKSPTNRKTFTPSALQEMADSILEKGIVQPIIARLVTAIEDEERRAAALKAGAKYEIVAGERRWRGSKLAKMATIPTIVRELNDRDALLTQAIENAQRENPQPLEEAAQYDELLRMGQASVKELAVHTGKSHTYIYGRVSLLRLPEKMKAALRDEKVSLPVAQLVARIPNPVVAEEAAKRILRGDSYGRPISLSDAQRFIFEECMMQLKGAPFDAKDKTLVPDAGPCALCPKRTGNEKELFADVGRADVCTDIVCFRAKCDASRARLLAKAKEEGKIVLSSEESAQLYPHHSHLNYEAPYVELSQACPFAPKKTWGEVIAKLPKAERPEVAVAVDKTGTLHELIGRKEAGDVARTLDLAKPAETRGSLSPESVNQRRQARESRERHEHTIRAVDLAITAVIEKQAKAKDTKALFRLLRVLAMKEANFDTERRVAKRYGFVTPKKDGDVRAYYATVAKRAEAAPLPLILETLLWHSSLFADRGLPEAMTTACKIYGIDSKKLEAAAKEKPAKAGETTLPALKK
jgi:ParB/RepB/Spo0J family partition protein